MAQRILVIDDNEEILELFRDLLSAEQYEVILSDFIDVNDICRIGPDMLILDYLNGLQPAGGQLLQRLKQQPATQHIPVLVCTTASAAKVEQEPAFRLHGVSVVQKPFDVSALLYSVEQALAQARA